ncbi:MAG: PQ-loop domain-containing transporter [Wolbachia endosymbiont of Armadillidium vulgare]|uniref:PQ-loop domain-containing transporter n=1 Tax=Wolbachia endosymbiont of Armadillidium arcangelii TaxID=3158571 RepID=A0AAU7Q3Y4_9RICK|nr:MULTISPECIES: PQ-loop domain-containing transporter [unclassified Wolbachia]OJH31616.1 PQ loop repeat [Wolbachia endosymbiont of Armadillidium vulgare]OJH32025.1 PQ loop repeat [Wolbachia endosymbiont of Armadillidium vulgare]OJH32582.1 PQ loop repeat [Wolbachia endosymbiont of Armadillidium vulgare]OJH33204.1 PQ loop repeat [Wolbachia endosymbiont of Armadillidium vulgare]RDD33904.1 PQ loop repeat [Wolbachia endosymbiont of Cylisticus convexus]
MYISIGKCFGFIALISSLVGLLPQVYKSYITKLTRDISMLIILLFVHLLGLSMVSMRG